MKRNSLQFKLSEIAKGGSLRTYSRQEALGHWATWPDVKFRKEKMIETAKAYEKGLILCSFSAYPGEPNTLNSDFVCQITTDLAAFVLNVVWPLNFQ